MRIGLSPGAGLRTGLGALALTLLAPAAISFDDESDRTLEYECGEFSQILEAGRWVQFVTAAQAITHGTTPDDVALHEYYARERLKEDVECLGQCPEGNPQTCLPAASFDSIYHVGIPEVLSGGYVYTFFGADAKRGCNPCF